MTTFCLEMRSTADWSDVRYREYTTSKRKADLFKGVPEIRFTDSGHHIIPVVKEHSGPKQPRNMILKDHVVDAITALNKAAPAKELPPHKTMTREEYDALTLKGWHLVCHDVDGFGGTGIRYLGDTAPLSLAERE